MEDSKNKIHLSELVSNPSPMTEHLVEIVLKLNDKYEGALQTKNIFIKFNTNFQLNMYLKKGCFDFYEFLIDYEVPKINFTGIRKINALFNEFEGLYDRLMLNNISLAYAHMRSKDISNPILTAEDKKNLYFKKYSKGEISSDEFKENFGHYALNAYELASRRFEEYSDEELMKLAEFTANLDIKQKPELREYLKNRKKDIIPILLALRELAKYNILFIVRDIRYELLNFADKHSIDNIFGKSFNEILNLEKLS